ncbi:snare protein YKT6 [Sistotremastrum niveocremeum HHB9708]|uniref:Snare protein YKT6 n=2 Tax=Sistotremastraceae TaxID=3402574 RepID=A0A164SIR1_9AGAM|nr:snare protein YKT6 [Sistotremastrum niveocremeum HHB9708]KZT39828.1 snare protein YKT6 [Sistotremastrum suecicum HHB10207 ss-3]
MRILSISIFHAPSGSAATLLSSASDLTSFSFYQRRPVGQSLIFLANTVVERTPEGQRQSVQENNYVAHVYNRGGTVQLAAVIITDQEYPVRAAFSVLTKVLDEFERSVPQSRYAPNSSSSANPIDFPELATYLQKYQDPRQADTILNLQQELDETKIVLHKTIEAVLRRGEKLDDLVERSAILNEQTKTFYKLSKKQNSCCAIM